MADRFTGANELGEFAIGDTTTVVQDLNANFDILQIVINSIGDALEAGLANPSISGDAALNQMNLLMNGEFRTTLANGVVAAGSLDEMPLVNETHGTHSAVHLDGWFFKSTTVDSGGESLAGTLLQDGLRIDQGSSSPYTGKLFQRLDYFLDVVSMRGRTFQVIVEYSTSTDDAFRLTVSDGVDTTEGDVGDTPTGNNQVVSISHTINAAATKLSVGIEFTSAVPTGAGAITIHRAFAKCGSGSIGIPQQVHPHQLSRDLLLASQFTYCEIIKDFGIGSVVKAYASDTEEASVSFVPHTPLVYQHYDDLVVQEFLDASSSNLGMSHADVSTDVDYNSSGCYSQNIRPTGAETPTRHLYLREIRSKITRSSSTLSGTGFLASYYGIGVQVIPPD